MLTGEQKVCRLLLAFMQTSCGNMHAYALLSGLFHRMEAATFERCVSALLPTIMQFKDEVVAFNSNRVALVTCSHSVSRCFHIVACLLTVQCGLGCARGV